MKPKTRCQSLGARLLEARRAAGKKQREAAEAAGVKPNSISDYELGKSEPTLCTLCLLAGFYGVPIASLTSDLE